MSAQQSTLVTADDQPASVPAKPTIPAGIAAALLKALGSDDAFRNLFKSDPRKALKAVGYELPASATTPMCMMVAELASKEEIQDAYLGLHAHLTGASRSSMQVVFTFEHGHIHDVLRR